MINEKLIGTSVLNRKETILKKFNVPFIVRFCYANFTSLIIIHQILISINAKIKPISVFSHFDAHLGKQQKELFV